MSRFLQTVGNSAQFGRTVFLVGRRSYFEPLPTLRRCIASQQLCDVLGGASSRGRGRAGVRDRRMGSGTHERARRDTSRYRGKSKGQSMDRYHAEFPTFGEAQVSKECLQPRIQRASTRPVEAPMRMCRPYLGLGPDRNKARRLKGRRCYLLRGSGNAQTGVGVPPGSVPLP